MHLGRGAHARLDRALDPRVGERRVLAGEVDPALGRADRVVQQRLLAGIEERERAAGELVVVPHLRCPDLVVLERLRVDPSDVLERLHEPVVGREGAPALRVLTPRVAGEHDAATGVAAVIGVVDVAHREIGHAPAAEDPVVVLPEAPPELEEHLRRRVVVQLADGALLRARERCEHLDVTQHRERRGDDGVVAGDREPPGARAVVHGHVVVGLVERDHLGAEADPRPELGEERAWQQVGAAVDVDEVGVAVAELLAQQLEERRVHQRLLVEQEAEHLDRAFRPSPDLEELAHAVLVEVGGDRRPGVLAFVAEPDLERLELRRPQLRGRHALVLGHVEAEPLGIAVQLRAPAAMAREEAVRRARCPS